MGIFNWIGGLFSGGASSGSVSGRTEINPATGLPMMEAGTGGVDVAGNPYGDDLHHWGDDHAHKPFPDGSTGPSPGDWDHWSSTAVSGHDHASQDPWRDP